MARYVAMLRGINVGKAKRVAMADLRAVLEGLGCTRVQTLLNSGNVVFDAPSRRTGLHARRIRAAVAAQLGVDAAVVVKTAAEIAAAIAAHPLQAVATDPSRLIVALSADAQNLRAISALADLAQEGEALAVGEHAAYVWCGKGILESKLAVALLKPLGEAGTTRNWATLQKIHALLQAA